MDEARGHTPDLGLNQDYSPLRVQATPKRSTNLIDNVAGQLYNCHQYRTPTTARLLSNDAGPTPSLHSPSSGAMSGGPMSGHPRLHTPVSGESSRRGLLTPRHMTPKGQRQVYNPFESPMMGRLHDQLDFSPNMFVENIPEESPDKFSWSIDQLATLQPVEIEDKEIEKQCKYYYQNGNHDVKAQKAIDDYFTHRHIAPSPWSEKAVHVLPRTPGAHSAESPMVLQVKPSGSRNKEITLLKEVGSQTELSLPKDFDLQKVLGEHYSKVNAGGEAQQGDEEGPADNLSSSSLRRKLFFQGVKKSQMSPAKSNTEADLTLSSKLSPPLSPVPIHKTPPRDQLISSGMETPGSNLFSSSPIHGHECREVGPMHFMTPSLRRCSTAPEIVDSPDFSPIVLSNKDLMHTPSSSLLQCTPQSCRPTKTFRSPGMSPIAGAEGSFMSSSTRSSSRRPETDRKVRLPFQECEDDLKDNDSIQQMDFDEDKTSEHNFNAQDTGYQTNSLQSTNIDGAVSSNNITGLDPVLPHTNLTVQFGNMYGNSDAGIEVEEPPAPIPRKVTSLISPTFTLIKNQEDSLVLSDYGVVGDAAVPYTRPRTGGVPVFPWRPDMLKTNSVVIKEKITGENPDGAAAGNGPPASEIARLALMRAGEDYDKFCVQKMYSHHDSPLKNGVESMSFDL